MDYQFCRHCGQKLPADALFCTKCGTRIVPLQDENVVIPPTPNVPQSENQPEDNFSFTSVLEDIHTMSEDTPPQDPRPTVDPAVVAATTAEVVGGTYTGELSQTPKDTKLPWDIPSFETKEAVTEPIAQDVVEEVVLPPSQEEVYEPVNEKVPVPPLPYEETREVPKQERSADPYLDETGIHKAHGTVPPRRRRKDDFDDTYDDEEYEEEYRPRRWPYVLLVILILLLAILASLFFFKPSVINSGIDAFNSFAHTHFNHIGEEKEEEPSPTPVVTVAPTPEPTPESTPEETPEVVEETPTPTPEPTPSATTADNYFSATTNSFASFYKSYLSAINDGTMSQLPNATDALRTDLVDRYNKFNSGYTFTNRKISVDKSTYKVSEQKSDGTFEVSFTAAIENDCRKKADNAYIDNKPVMDITLTYNPTSNSYTVSKMMIVQKNVSTNDLVQINN